MALSYANVTSLGEFFRERFLEEHELTQVFYLLVALFHFVCVAFLPFKLILVRLLVFFILALLENPLLSISLAS